MPRRAGVLSQGSGREYHHGVAEVPKIVGWYMDGKININDSITHTMPVEYINGAFDLMDAWREHPLRGGR